ncbi:MAG: tetratricopeptide repeat protein [Bernardetiaceae bacterium]|jgi:serine phosphatase RsbU (regulator of sigma subunit)|nr:tetratricopeptide repeat protein [Bernardetiaceae bacterium]
MKVFCLLIALAGALVGPGRAAGQPPATSAVPRLATLLAQAERCLAARPDSVPFFAQQALQLAQQERDTTAICRALKYLSTHAAKAGQTQASTAHLMQLLRIGQHRRDTLAIVETLNEMSLGFRMQRKFDEALQMLRQALGYLPRPGQAPPSLLGNLYNQLGATHYMAARYDSALYFFEKSYTYRLQAGVPEDVAKSLNNLGLIYKRQGRYDRALTNFMECKRVLERSKDSLLVTNTTDNIGDVYNLLGNHQTALQYHLEGLALARRSGFREKVWDSYQSLAETYHLLHNYQQAYRYAQLQNALKDSLYDEQNARQMAELKSRYDDEQQKSAIALLTKEKELSELQVAENRRRNWFLLAGVGLSLGLGLVMLNRSRLKAKANRLLQAQRDEIAAQSRHLSEALTELDKKNRDLQGSINYASRIQNAILPSLAQLQACVPQSFVLYRPKQIVSGDFYWFAPLPTPDLALGKRFMLAVADCTGHGVPGAFMSLIASKLLSEIVVTRGIHAPNQVLHELDEGVRQTLNQTENANRDGLEIALCLVDLGQMTLQFAGAKSPLYMVRAGALHELKGTRLAIGGHAHEARPYELQQLPLQPGDVCYLCTDGYQDQFGQATNRKLMPKRLKEMLIAQAPLPMPQQQAEFTQALAAWQGDQPQTDDVLLAGFRVGAPA